MNYEKYLNQIELNNDEFALGDIVFFTKDNNQVTIPTTYGGNYHFDELCYYVANYSNNNGYGSPIAFMVQADNGLYLINSTYIDFCTFYYAGPCSVSMGRAYPNESGDIRDGTTTNNYLNTNTNTTFDWFTFGYYSRSVVDNIALFDYTSLEYSNNVEYYQDSYSIRGENVTFYNNYLIITNNGSGSYAYGYGSPFRAIRESSYDTGYGAGYATGWVEGNNNGFENGQASQIDSATYNAFAYIGTTFNFVGGLMAIEVLPHITLGLCFSIPLVFVLIMTIFKLVKK